MKVFNMFQDSKKQHAFNLQKPPPVQRLPRVIPRSALQYNKTNFTMKGNMTLLEPKSVAEKSVKSTQQTALPTTSKVPQKTQKRFGHTGQTVLPPVSRGLQKTQPGLSLNLHTVLPPIRNKVQKNSHQHAIEQGESTQSRKPFPKETSVSKERQKVSEMPTVERLVMSPESVLKDSKPYLTEYELEEIKNYKQVWYLGKTADKTCHSNITKTQDTESINSGYDTEDGYYKVIINEHLAYRFEILEVIGTGYSGQVLKCMDHKTTDLVAIKVIRNKDRVRRVGNAEVKILETLRELDKSKTANIVHMKESFYFRNHLCITFELFEKDLYKALKESGPCGFSEKEVRKYSLDVLKCLEMLKKKSIIHGDLKPENILLYTKDSETRTALSDFGGSHFVKHRDHPFIHTLYYMAPEMLLGKTCSPAVDMWSLGCMLAELYLGHHLFHGCDIVDQFSCIMKVLGIPPNELLTDAPRRHYFFDSDGIPLKIKDISRNSTSLFEHLNTKNHYFLDFIQCCLEYDPTKRITPEEALKHPWIRKYKKLKPVTSARKNRPVSSSNKKPVLFRRDNTTQLKPIRKTKANKCRD